MYEVGLQQSVSSVSKAHSCPGQEAKGKSVKGTAVGRCVPRQDGRVPRLLHVLKERRREEARAAWFGR